MNCNVNTILEKSSKKIMANSLFYCFVKRMFDFVLALIAIIILMPLYLVISLFVFIGNPGPIVYGQIRVGKNGKLFKMWKFRSMYKNADEMIDKLSDEQKEQYIKEFKIDNDPRITKVGGFLRKTSLDELPQLFNVLCNEMSLVGPRPLIESEIKKYYSTDYEILTSVKPGVTGYWQAYARNNATYQSGLRQQMELYYVNHKSILFDVRILFKTVIAVLRKDGAQ